MGFVNSTKAVGNWSVPQESGDDRPRGDKSYDSWDMKNGFSHYGITKKLEGFNIQNDKLTKGLVIINGYLLELEEDEPIGEAVQIVVGVENNPPGRWTFISFNSFKESIEPPTLSRDSGHFEVVMWEKEGDEWKFVFPISTAINSYLQTILLSVGGNNIYDIEVYSFPDSLINTPSEYNLINTSLTVYVPKISTSGDTNKLRLRKSDSVLDVEFDEDTLKLGINKIFFYIDSDTNKIKATTRRKK